MSDWISVEDGLPKKAKGKPWLVYANNGVARHPYICRAWYLGYCWVYAFGSRIEPTHYQPLPDDPEVEDE